jgi:hypothetical protein
MKKQLLLTTVMITLLFTKGACETNKEKNEGKSSQEKISILDENPEESNARPLTEKQIEAEKIYSKRFKDEEEKKDKQQPKQFMQDFFDWAMLKSNKEKTTPNSEKKMYPTTQKKDVESQKKLSTGITQHQEPVSTRQLLSREKKDLKEKRALVLSLEEKLDELAEKRLSTSIQHSGLPSPSKLKKNASQPSGPVERVQQLMRLDQEYRETREQLTKARKEARTTERKVERLQEKSDTEQEASETRRKNVLDNPIDEPKKEVSNPLNISERNRARDEK